MSLRRHKPVKDGSDYRKIWRLVDGAVRDTIAAHPDYFPEGKSLSDMRRSVTKRVTGSVLGWAEQSAWGRSGESRRSNAEDGVGRSTPDGSAALPPIHVGIGSGVDGCFADAGRGESHAPAQTPPPPQSDSLP